MRLVCLLSVLAILGYQQGSSQSPYFKLITPGSEHEGLKYTALMCDRDGFLWIGTSAGLYQYDGTSFQHYILDSSAYGNEFTALAQGPAGAIVAGLRSGAIATLEDGRLRLDEPEEGFPAKAITSLAFGTDSILWMATAGEGVYFQKDGRYYNIDQDDGLNDNYTYCIMEGPDGEVWIGSDQGIAICRADENQKVKRQIRYADGLPDEIILDLKMVKGRVVVATQDKGLCLIQPGQTGVTRLPSMKAWPFGAAHRVVAGPGEYWIAGGNQGLFCIRGEEARPLRRFQKVEGRQLTAVRDLVRDRDGGLWAVSGAGLVYTPGNQFNFLTEVPGFPLSDIDAILCDREGRIICSPGQGLLILQPGQEGFAVKRVSVTDNDSQIDIVSLFEDDWGFIWIGTLGGGLYRMNPRSLQVRPVIGFPGGKSATILAINGKGPGLWLATFGGVVRLKMDGPPDRDHIQCFFEVADAAGDLGNYYIYDVFIDSKGRTWFATDGRGVVYFDGRRYRTPADLGALNDQVVYSFTEDSRGRIWFSTAQSGVYSLDDGKLKNYGLSEGLREPAVSALSFDGHRHIVMVHRSGIDLLDITSGEVSYHGADHHLDNLNPDLNTLSMDRNGNLWIGVEQGIVVYRPGMAPVRRGLRCVIRRVTLLADGSAVADGAVLRHDQQDLSVEFSSVAFTNAGRVVHEYKLTGYHEKWIATSDNRIIFPNLPPGYYVLEIRGSGNGQFALSDIAKHSFRIQAPFWKRLWFQLCFVIVVSTLVVVYLRNRERRLRHMEALKKEKIEYQFETLKSQVNPHFLFNSFNTLVSVIEQDRKLAVEYVEMLSDFFRSVVGYKDRELITLQEELDLARSYYEIQKKRFGAYLVLNIDVETRHLSGQVPPLVLQILIENAIKHNSTSSESPLTIEIYTVEGRLYIKNNLNPKKTLEPSTGTGLQNVRNRYQLLSSQKVRVDRDEMFFTVSIPLIGN